MDGWLLQVILMDPDYSFTGVDMYCTVLLLYLRSCSSALVFTFPPLCWIVNPAAQNTEWTFHGVRPLGGYKEPRGAPHPAARDTAFGPRNGVMIGSSTLFQGCESVQHISSCGHLPP